MSYNIQPALINASHLNLDMEITAFDLEVIANKIQAICNEHLGVEDLDSLDPDSLLTLKKKVSCLTNAMADCFIEGMKMGQAGANASIREKLAKMNDHLLSPFDTFQGF